MGIHYFSRRHQNAIRIINVITCIGINISEDLNCVFYSFAMKQNGKNSRLRALSPCRGQLIVTNILYLNSHGVADKICGYSFLPI